MYIISTGLNEDARIKAFDKIKESIEKKGGQVLKVHDQGKKRLAFAIGPHREGHYFLAYFEVDPKAIDEMWQEYHLNENLVRFLTMRTDEILEEVKFPLLPEL